MYSCCFCRFSSRPCTWSTTIPVRPFASARFRSTLIWATSLESRISCSCEERSARLSFSSRSSLRSCASWPAAVSSTFGPSGSNHFAGSSKPAAFASSMAFCISSGALRETQFFSACRCGSCSWRALQRSLTWSTISLSRWQLSARAMTACIACTSHEFRRLFSCLSMTLSGAASVSPSAPPMSFSSCLLRFARASSLPAFSWMKPRTW
mmetsp:Transcript_107233/g.303170  ORF Transcript_107233/g.303170 Transcript_107233/m.303170 type:complete len:209 (-) Transcript_107233:147-773(-)